MRLSFVSCKRAFPTLWERYNDAVCDFHGRLWRGTYDVALMESNGGIYRIEAHKASCEGIYIRRANSLR